MADKAAAEIKPAGTTDVKIEDKPNNESMDTSTDL